MESTCMLTTFDNPFNPFDEFKSWFEFDVAKGYYSCAYLARIAQIEDDFSEEETNAEIERAIDEIINNDFLNIYKKVKQNAVEAR